MPKIKLTRKMLSIPYAIFLVLFVIIPLLLVVFYAFTDEAGKISFQNVVTFFSNSTNLNTFIISILIGIANTAICLIIGWNRSVSKPSLCTFPSIFPHYKSELKLIP